MSVGKFDVTRRSRVGLGALTCSKAGRAGVIARRILHPSVGQFKGRYYGNMKMVEVKHNHGCIIKATHDASACNCKVRWNFTTMEPAVKMLRDVQVEFKGFHMRQAAFTFFSKSWFPRRELAPQYHPGIAGYQTSITRTLSENSTAQ